jgi:glutamate racemase
MTKIGVFDSGIGGQSIADAILRDMPELDVLFVHDDAPGHFPYATKSPDEIYGFVTPIFQDLVNKHCDIIVVACNTVSTTLIGRLREQFAVPMVAIEPMVKPAAEQTKSKIIAVCATPTTLASDRYKWLKDTYAPDVTVLEPDCADWSYLIEHSRMDEDKIREDIEPALAGGADVVVLGCTHYHWIEDEVKQITAGKALVLQPETAIVAQLRRELARLS